MDSGEQVRPPPAPTLKAVALRVGPALLLLTLTLVVVAVGSWFFSIWVAIFGVLMAREWNAIAYRGVEAPGFPAHMACLVLVLAAVTLGYSGAALIVLLLGIAVAVGMTARARLDVKWTALGLLYTIVPLAALVWLRTNAVAPVLTVVWLMGVVWATDTAALVTGRLIGGPLLAPRVSPRKTWAGLAGGVFAASLVGVGFGEFCPGASPLILALVSAVLAVVAQLGDLTESAFKRRFGVKDSSQLIPGQGGVLDRVDGLVFATVAVLMLALAQGSDVLSVGGQP